VASPATPLSEAER